MLILQGDIVTAVGKQPPRNFFVHHDISPPGRTVRSLAETTAIHSYPGLLVTDLMKGTALGAALLPIGKSLEARKAIVATRAFLQFLDVGAQCVRRVRSDFQRLSKRSLDPCVSTRLWGLEIGPDGVALKLIVDPQFEMYLRKMDAGKGGSSLRPGRLEGALRSLTGALPL